MKKDVLRISIIMAVLVVFAVAMFFVLNDREVNAAVACATGCNGAYGFAYNYNNIYEAQQRAMQECQKYCGECRIFHSNGSRGWGALARNEQTGRIGVGTGYGDQVGAEQRALQECGYGCIIKHTWNDTVGTVGY